MRLPGLLLRFVACLIAGSIGAAIAEAEAPSKTPDVPEKTPPEATAPESVGGELDPLREIAEGMKKVGERLDQGLLDDETRLAQRKVVDDLEKLLRQSQKSKQKNPSPNNSNSPQQDQSNNPSEGQSSENSAGGNPGERRRNDQENAAESQERTKGGIPTEADRKNQRRVLTDAVWGHLPPRVREQLNRSFSDRYLPEYDSLVKRYYEALATRRRDVEGEPPRDSGATRPLSPDANKAGNEGADRP